VDFSAVEPPRNFAPKSVREIRRAELTYQKWGRIDATFRHQKNGHS